MACEALDAEDLAESAEIQRHIFNLITPPGISWLQPMSPPVVPFDAATVALAKTAAALTREGSLVSVAGGGDTVAALNHAGVAADFTFVSTAGGAFLKWMEGKPLPGVDALRL